jgi:copper transport protein
MEPGDGLSNWALAAAVNRGVLYLSMLLAAGSALFPLIVNTPTIVANAAARLGRIAAIIAVIAYVLAIGMGGADMIMGSSGALLSAESWAAGFDTTLRNSAIIGIAGMALLAYGSVSKRAASAVLAAGVALAVLSFLVTGHAVTAEPVWFTAPMVAIHLLSAAFWLGALWPLYVAARDLPVADAGALMAQFSKRAVYAVTVLILSGSAIACVQMGSLGAFITTGYGFRLAVKLGLVALLLALADYNKVALTPRLIAGDLAAPARLQRSIAVEYAVYVLIIAAAASLALAVPPRALG